MGRPPIVLMDRHAGRRAEVCMGLALDSLPVVVAESEQALMELLARLQPQMLIVGVLPHDDVLAIYATMQQWAGVPILVLLDAQPPDQIAALLKCGADDYLRSPFTPDELRARVQQLLRRTAGNDGRLCVGGGELILDPQTQTVQVRGVAVELTPIEHRLLWQLARQAGTVLTYTDSDNKVCMRFFSEGLRPSKPPRFAHNSSGVRITPICWPATPRSTRPTRPTWRYMSRTCGRSWNATLTARGSCGRSAMWATNCCLDAA